MVTWLYKTAGQQMEAQIKNKNILYILVALSSGNFLSVCHENKITTFVQAKAVNINNKYWVRPIIFGSCPPRARDYISRDIHLQ